MIRGVRVAALGVMFRRDRLTGQVAVGLVGVLGIAAAVYGVGVASARYRVADVGAWLTARSKGLVVHVNGPAGKVDGRTGVIARMRGHDLVKGGRTVSATSATLAEVATNGPYTFTVAAVNGAGTGPGATREARLTGPATRYPVERNENSTGYVRDVPDAGGGTAVTTMKDNNGENVAVNCQVKGAYHRRNDALAGDMYANITYGGRTGYTIGYLVNTPGDWKSFAGLPVWRCEPS